LVLRYLFPKKYDVKTNIDALIGKSGLVTEKIISHLQTGRVRIGGEDWKAVSLTGSDIEVGQKVTVEQVEGVKVLVRRQN
jgi:membrane protein implicated in regulation of membrane protease activity